MIHRLMVAGTIAAVLAGCSARQPSPAPSEPASAAQAPSFHGTLEPFASEAVYFVLTDRFVNGDPANDHRDQGGERGTFDIPLEPCDGVAGNIGYLGGDFRGLLDNAGYIRDMGFTAVWLTPIVDNPDEAFSGGDDIHCTSFLSDRGKTGYHGYWGVNFFELDEHLPSADLDFAGLTRGLREHGLKTVLDVVGNHGSPAYTMTVDQPKFGKLYGRDGTLLADHQNLPPAKLDPANNPLHRFYNTQPDLAQLADLDPDNPEVMDYLVEASLHWIGQGVDALRIDTIRHQPLPFWKQFTDRIRAEHPGMYMFGEAFDDKAENIAPFTLPENGGVSVLDFPMKTAMVEVFGSQQAGFERLADTLYLEGGPYANVYDLATFYDNHDMPRIDASDEGFIDAHNWLFTVRGIPVIYYGSETGFMRGHGEHGGNRAYFGQDRIDTASQSLIHTRLTRIASLRRDMPALQRGLQLNLELAGDRAAFYRVYQHGKIHQTALVLLNKGDSPTLFELGDQLQPGHWRHAFDGKELDVVAGAEPALEVAGHDVSVWLLDASVTDTALLTRLDRLMQHR